MADLHTHTRASDGILEPTELVERAAARGVRVLAITDHDTVASVVTGRQVGAQIGVRVVAGVEISASAPSGSLHLLGYFPGDPPAGLVEDLALLAAARQVRAAKIVSRLAELGAPIDIDRVQARAAGTVGRPHIAEALVAAGHARTIQEAFDRFIHDGGPAWVGHRNLSGQEAVRLVRRHGGAPVVAHPGSLRLSHRQLGDYLRRLAHVGLMGVEVHRPEHTPEQRQRYHDVGRAVGLVLSGGSDFHRPDQPVDLGDTGVPRLPITAIDHLLERAADSSAGA